MPQRAEQIKVFAVRQRTHQTPRHNTVNVSRRRVKRQGGGLGGLRGEGRGAGMCDRGERKSERDREHRSERELKEEGKKSRFQPNPPPAPFCICVYVYFI